MVSLFLCSSVESVWVRFGLAGVLAQRFAELYIQRNRRSGY